MSDGIVYESAITYQADEALAKYRLVKLTTAKTETQPPGVSYADAGDKVHGVTTRPAAIGENVACSLLAAGAIRVEAGGTIAANADCWPGADGKLMPTGSGAPFTALTGGVSGDWLLVLPPAMSARTARHSVNTETLADDKTLTIGDASLQYLDPGGSARDLILPAEALSVGAQFTVVNTADNAEAITVKDDAAATVATIAQDEMAILTCNGVAWRGLVGTNT